MRVSFLMALLLGGCSLWADSDLDQDGVPWVDDCDDSRPSVGLPPTWYEDSDGDGFGDPEVPVVECTRPDTAVANDDDCDDSDPALHPQTPWYRDSDGDGHGDPNQPAWGCPAPAGFVALADDCDDLDPTRHPGADETCDGVDQDCDDQVDEDPVDATPWYRDRDGDGWGDGALVRSECQVPDGYVGDSTDCDDTLATVHPGALESCDEVDQDCDGLVDEDPVDPPSWFVDGDGDGWGQVAATVQSCTAPSGYVADSTDCDDTLATAHPGADETCDGVDQDCDGSMDESPVDATTWYLDSDRDGFGNGALSLDRCEAPPGYVPDGTDCDDGRSDTWPGAPETCDGADQDCDGAADEDPTDPSPWYRDGDGDTWGDPLDSTLACGAPAGFVAASGDCDPFDAGIHPGLEEVCDGVDQDCDGAVDEDALDAPTWYADTDRDGQGDPASFVAACEPPEGSVALDTDCDDGRPDVFFGAPETCDGVDQDCDGAVDDAPVDPTAWYPDADLDGWGDPASETWSCTAPPGWGATAGDCDDTRGDVFPGADERCNDLDDDCDGTADEDPVDPPTWYVDADRDGYGHSDYAMDFGCATPSGDLYSLAPGDCDDTTDTTHPGAPESCNAVDDDCNGDTDEGPPADAPTWYQDADGDGFADPGESRVSCSQPASYLDATLATDCDDTDAGVSPGAEETCNDGVDNNCDGLPASCSAVLADVADSTFLGVTDGDQAGTCTTSGDLDGDGETDLVAGAPYLSTELATVGAVYVVSGPLADQGARSLGDADVVRIVGEVATDSLGTAVSAADWTGDGQDDLVVAASMAEDRSLSYSRERGRVWFLEGPVDASSTLGAAWVGAANYDELGTRLVAMEWDGDGACTDLVLSSAKADAGVTNAGRLFLLPGPVEAPAADQVLASVASIQITGRDTNDYLGYSLVGADVDGDGTDEIATGSFARSSSAGAVFVIRAGDLAAGSSIVDDVGVSLPGRDGEYAGRALASQDFDDDGYEDLAVGAILLDSNRGGVYIVSGASIPDAPASLPLVDSQALLEGVPAAWLFGEGLATERVGDQPALLVGAYGYPDGVSNVGAAYLFYGPFLGRVDTETSHEAFFTGAAADDRVNRVDMARGVGADGTAALVFGTPMHDIVYENEGAIFLVSDIGL